MKQRTQWMNAVLFAALASTGSYAAAQEPDGSFERTFEIDAPIDLDVATGRGDVTIRAGTGDLARVTGHISIGRSGGWRFNFWRRDSRLSEDEAEALIRLFETNPPVEMYAGELRVGHFDDEWRRNVSMSYEIELPPGTDIRSRTGSGRQSVEGLSGEIEATTGSGRIDLADLTGRISVRTGSGAIRATNINGNVEGQTGSGSMTVAGSPLGPWNLRSGSGSVNLRLPADAQFSLDARAGSGGISTDHPLTVQGSMQRGQLTGQVRGGGPLITARTGSGGIQIE